MLDRDASLRVAIVENSALFREGLALQLGAAGMEVVAQNNSARNLFETVRQTSPHLVMMDIRMPPTETDEGIRAARELRRRMPDIGILILSTYAESTYASAVLAISNRSIGYLLKDRVADISALLDALQRISDGECVIDPAIVESLLHLPPRSAELDRLSAREKDVLRLMAEGMSNASIARTLFLTVRTIEAHTAMIFSKLGLNEDPQTNRRVAAVIAWLRNPRTTD
ncbi:response regulator transcription factor [Nocardioides korecus]